MGDLDVIFADKKKLQRVINNLLGNAVKYTKNGYIKIKATIAEPDVEWNLL